MNDWDDAVMKHFEYALVEVDALKSYFNDGDDESEPDYEHEKLEEVRMMLVKLAKRIGEERGW